MNSSKIFTFKAKQVKKKQKILGKLKMNYQAYLLLFPAFILTLIFNYIPIYGIIIAFKNYSPRKGILGSAWVGFKHFSTFFNSPFFGKLLWNTISLSLYQLVIGFFAPIIIALMLNSLRREGVKKKIQLIIYAPHFISTVVLVGMIFVFSGENGLFNDVVKIFTNNPIYFMAEKNWFRHLYVLSGVWQDAGWASIIYLAALANVSPELIDAAVVDGANPWQRIWHVDLPAIRPVIIILFVLAVGNVMNLGFEKAYLMQTSLNLDTSEIISTYVYKRGLQMGEYSFSTAVGLFNSFINLILLLSVNFAVKKYNEDNTAL